MAELKIDISNSDSENEYIVKSEDDEPLLSNENNRLTVYPIKYKDIWQMYKTQLASIWTVEEVDLSKDLNDWNSLDKNERHFIKNILAFFAASDGIVNVNLRDRFLKEVKIYEAVIAYEFQCMMENIHAEAYSLMIDTYIRNTLEKEKLLNAVENIPSIKKKADWAFKWIESDCPFAQRLFAFAIVEGVFFSGAFAAIFWLKDRNLLPGLCKFNKFIARDEGMHTDFACHLYSMLNSRIDKDTVEQIMREAVDIEKEFIVESIPCNLIGINSKLMSKYIEFVANRLLIQLGYDIIYNVPTNPLDFMEKISIQSKGNFFEERVDEYQKHDAHTKFEINDDF